MRRILLIIAVGLLGAVAWGNRPAYASNDLWPALDPAGGYWTADTSGTVIGHNGAPFYGDMSGKHLNQPIANMTATPSAHGYWLVATDGGIFSFGSAAFYGSTGSIRLNQPIVGVASTPSGHGYWLAASDGGIFAFGDAAFYGSTGSIRLNQPIVGVASTPSGHGYWLAASDGGIFAFGDAAFYGSTGSIRLNQPIVGMASTPSGHGYWLAASDGGIFAFGDAPFLGSGVGKMRSHAIGLAPVSSATSFGYSVLGAAGDVIPLQQPITSPAGSPQPSPDNPPAPGTWTLPAAVKYVTPAGSGLKDGSSWYNAAPLTQVAALAAQLPPGGEVWLLANAGVYSSPAPIMFHSNHGTATAPVRVRGALADGTPAAAEIDSTRASPWVAGSKNTGDQIFRLLSGANNLWFSDLTFRNVGMGAFRIGGDISNITIDSVQAWNVRRFIEDYPSEGAKSASVNGLVVRNAEVHGYSKSAIQLKYDSSNVLIQDVLLDSEGQTGDNFAIGVHLDGTAHTVTLRRVTALNNHYPSGAYWNGDGFATEDNTYDINFDHTNSSGNDDAGYDIKSKTTTLTDTSASANKRNYRIWSNGVTITDCTGTDPHVYGGTGSQDQLWANSGAHVTLTNCLFTDSSPSTVALALEGSAYVSVTNTPITIAPGATKYGIASQATLLVDGVRVK